MGQLKKGQIFELVDYLQQMQLSVPDLLSKSNFDKEQLLMIAYVSYLRGIQNSRTRMHYKMVIDHFARFLKNTRGINMLQAQPIDVTVWREDLEKTGGAYGMKADFEGHLVPNVPASVENKTCSLSSFYDYLKKPGLHNGQKLLENNPVDGLVTRHKIEKYGRSKKIHLDTFKALMREIDRSTILGKRDFALLYGYFMTGRRNTEWVTLQWGNINLNQKPPTYTFRGKGGADFVDEIPAPIWRAIEDYCSARWGKNFRETLPAETYLFTAIEGRGGKRQQEDTNHHLTEQYVRKLVKVLARRAGVDPEKITVHSLRHLHAKTNLDAGADIKEVQARLRHKSVATTDVYLASDQNQVNKYADKLDEMFNSES